MCRSLQHICDDYVVTYSDITCVLRNLGSIIRVLERGNSEWALKALKEEHAQLEGMRDQKIRAHEVTAKYLEYLEQGIKSKGILI